MQEPVKDEQNNFTGRIVVFDISFAGRTLIVATQDNLHLCMVTGDKAAITYSFPLNTPGAEVRKIDENHWAAGTDGAGLFLIKREIGIMSASAIDHPAFEGLRIPELVAGPGRTLLIATREAGVIRAEFNENFSSLSLQVTYNMLSGLPENDIKTIFRDREENLWIGLFNRGLAAVTTNAFSFFAPEMNKEVNFIGESEGKVILGNRNGLYDFDPDTGNFSNWRDLNRKTGGSGIVSGIMMDQEISGLERSVTVCS
jgi:ligand-binding sensor domain-containing protein